LFGTRAVRNGSHHCASNHVDRFDCGICECEVYDKIMNLKVEKSTIGIPKKCLKLAANHIYEALTIVFNNSLQLGIFPDIFKISGVTPVDKGGIIIIIIIIITVFGAPRYASALLQY